MKRIALVVTALCSAMILMATAQEEPEGSPAEKIDLRATEPTGRNEPSVLVETSPPPGGYPKPGTSVETPTPRPTPKPTATPAKAASTPTPTPRSSPTPTPKRDRRRTTPSPAPKPSPAAAATSSPLPRNAAAAVKQLENRWADAIAAHEPDVVKGLVADDYIGVSATGKIVNKSTLLADMRKDNNVYDSAINSGVTVRVHGDTAVVVGTTTQVGKTPAGTPFRYIYRWTDTWVRKGDQWQAVASQSILAP